MSKAKLKPCPFCGAEPEVTEWISYLGVSVMVECTNEKCDIQPHTDYFPKSVKGLATRCWNKRAKMDEEAT